MTSYLTSRYRLDRTIVPETSGVCPVNQTPECPVSQESNRLGVSLPGKPICS